ncbi:MAG: LPP20 family lipoprotein [Treponema sp.]|nr:LPP20 family lipoprotein [Treponema sp.]
MKKLYVLFIAILAVALVFGCASTPSAPRMDAPEWVDDLPPEDAFWGIGIAKLQNESLARDTAISRARRDVAAQMSTLVQSMLTDYAREAGTLNNSASIQSIERVTQELVNVNLSGAIPNAQKRMPDGTWWVRVALLKADANRVVNEVFDNEAARYADFRAAEASRMMQDRIAQTESRPTPRSID